MIFARLRKDRNAMVNDWILYSVDWRMLRDETSIAVNATPSFDNYASDSSVA